MLEPIGAVPMLVPPQESQDALAKGIVDGAGFPHEAGFAYDLASVAPYAIDPPLASATFALVMNPAKYNSLPPDLRAILDKESGVAGADELRQGLAGFREVRARTEITRRACKINTLPPADVAKMKELAKPIIEKALDELEKAGQAGARILRGLHQVTANASVSPATRALGAIPTRRHRDEPQHAYLLDRLRVAQLRLASIALIVMMGVTLVDVFMRYVFNNPIRGAYEMVEAMLLVFVFNGMSTAFLQRRNIVIDLIDTFAAPRCRRRADPYRRRCSPSSTLCLFAYAMITPALQSYSYGERQAGTAGADLVDVGRRADRHRRRHSLRDRRAVRAAGSATTPTSRFE